MKQTPGLFLLCCTLAAGAAQAEPPAASPRPQHRDADTVSRAAPLDLGAPVARPTTVVQAAIAGVVAQSVRPPVRPENLKRRTNVIRAGFARQPKITYGKGAICGDPGIEGRKMSPIGGRLNGCGIEDPVQLTAVSGVTLTTPATVDCTTAKALKSWVDRGVTPVVGRLGGGVAKLRVAASYVCRGRNNVKGAKLSEHGKGRAIDISAIVLRNGAELSVLKGWRNPDHAAMMKTMHRAACGPFGTVLGPAADRHHQDHFHLDTARYRSGSYCR
ncbi:extensin family protein [Oceaniglobus roseus]|uniref:extensin-like domain-containing protein n=1 Tax=Oceaniglobus roseus TaxID=1737570 RepID=UPI001FE8B69D|nr:extensin family protein [Kandeliimicrobium roseum]